jgi:DNA-binding CsgD family transcriptional regulator
MIHLLLLSYALTVFLGTVSAVYTLQAYRSLKLPYLRPVYVYSVIFLVSVFCGQILEYVYINILKGNFQDIPAKIVISWSLFLAIARLLMLYTIGRALLRMKALPGKGLFFAGFTLISLFQMAPGIVILTSRLPLQSPASILRITLSIGEFLAAALIGWLLVLKAPKNGQRSFSNFGLLFTAWYAAQFAIDIAFNPSAAYYANSVLLLPVSAIPFLWIKYGVLREMGKSRSEESRDLSGRLLESFKISAREEEIIRLILQGMSNKDIQAALFISPNTVKNHIYNIYQKMNVKSRLQLVSVILNLTSSANGTP